MYALTQMSDALDNLLTEHMKYQAGIEKRKASAKERNKKAEEAERGSFLWWASICRKQTGTHFLDSGFYGYAWERSLPEESQEPIWYDLNENEDGTYHVEYASISLTHWLHNMLDAADETATKIEKQLHRFANAEEDRYWDERGVEKYRVLHYSWEEILDIFKGSRLDLNFEYPGYMTYNHDNDMDQDFSIAIFTRESDPNEHFAIVRIHTGADIRGGWTGPYIVKVKDVDYVHDINVSFSCSECNEDFYLWGESWERLLAEQELVSDESFIPAVPLVCPECGGKVWPYNSGAYGF